MSCVKNFANFVLSELNIFPVEQKMSRPVIEPILYCSIRMENSVLFKLTKTDNRKAYFAQKFFNSGTDTSCYTIFKL